jgi:hypothetical protein
MWEGRVRHGENYKRGLNGLVPNFWSEEEVEETNVRTEGFVIINK